MKISIIHGICMRYDAISNAIADQLTWLHSAGHQVKLYTYACDRPELQCHIVHYLRDVAFDRHFQQSDVVIFHYGITYPLFDLLPLVARRACRLVAFHNITPKAYVAEAQHATIDRSFKQMANIAFADHVLCDSATNLDALRAARIATPATILPLAVSTPPQAPARKPSASDGVTRIAFIGRLVASKGPRDLLSAVRHSLRELPHARIELDMVTNQAFSDPNELAAVGEASTNWPHEFNGRASLRLHCDAPEELKQRILADADLFVLPTRHEGFCVPIVEALGNGCQVIAYSNSNTPAISGGHASLVPTGDTGALGTALTAAITQTASAAWHDITYPAHALRTGQYAQQFAPALIEVQFLELVAQLGWRKK